MKLKKTGNLTAQQQISRSSEIPRFQKAIDEMKARFDIEMIKT